MIVTITYRDGDSHTFLEPTENAARRAASEECRWENTREATVTNADGEHVATFYGDFA